MFHVKQNKNKFSGRQRVFTPSNSFSPAAVSAKKGAKPLGRAASRAYIRRNSSSGA
jgi:hypothetical protein